MREVNLAALNSATKYPSIPTYHHLDPKNGSLTEERTAPPHGLVMWSEKIDGTNSRIIQAPSGDYLIGSREMLLYASGDLVHNPAEGIVDALRAIADRLTPPTDGVRVLYGETYGGKITGASKQYTGTRKVGFRVFDAAHIPGEALTWPRERISSWRENGGQQYLTNAELSKLTDTEGLDLAPDLGTGSAADLPITIEDTHAFLTETLPTTLVALDDGAGRRPEGIVLRTPDRKWIAKARFTDYARTLKRRKKTAK